MSRYEVVLQERGSTTRRESFAYLRGAESEMEHIMRSMCYESRRGDWSISIHSGSQKRLRHYSNPPHTFRSRMWRMSVVNPWVFNFWALLLSFIGVVVLLGALVSILAALDGPGGWGHA